MINVFLGLFAIMVLGALLRHGNEAMEQTRQQLNKLVLTVFLPALVFHTVMNSEIDRLFLTVPAAAAGGVLGCLAVGFLVFHFLPIPGPTKGAMMLASAFGNVTYLGLPVLLGLFPDNAIGVSQVSVLFEVTKSSLNLTLGAMIAIAYGSHEKITFRKTALEALKLPPIWALGAALLWKSTGIPCPAFLLEASGVLASAVSGIMILSLGMALRFRWTHLMLLAVPVAVVKLIISPLLVMSLTEPLDLTGITRSAVILEGAMPSQLLSFVIAGRFKLDDETMAFVIMVDTLLCGLTIPLIHHLLLAS